MKQQFKGWDPKLRMMVLLGTLYEAEKLYEEHGMSTYGFNHM
ncbi:MULTISPECIES: hypothetical protein [Solibacillus]|nr:MULTISPECIES: hypothetical protein [Solibacillus]